MASDLSSDSEFSSPDDRYHVGHGKASNKVDHLAATLQGTNKNLRAMDRMLDDYRGMGDKQEHKMDKLRGDLTRTTERLRDEKQRSRRRSKSPRGLRVSDLDDYTKERPGSGRRPSPTSPLKDYETASDRDYRHGHPPPHGRSGAVRFYDDMDTHQVHQGIRDLTSHQTRLAGDLNTEVDRRNRWESESKRTFQELHEAMRKPDSTMTSVDKRLQSIQDELRTERVQLKKKHEEVGKISSELKKALDNQKVPAMDETSQLKARAVQSDSQRNLIDEIKKQLSRSDEEKCRMKSHLDQQEESMKEARRKFSYGEHERDLFEKERSRMDSELHDLRTQLGKSVSVVKEYSDSQRELDRSERQRTQLSDHIEVLNKDLEEREKQMAKVITQSQSMAEKYEECEQHRKHLTSQLQDTLDKLRETSKVSESCSAELRDTQRHLQDSEGRKEEIKARAQETVRQWKVKCKKLERDVDRYKHSTEQASTRCEQLIKELEASRNHSNTAVQQLEHIKREFSELLAIRAQQDEQVRLKDIEVNELKSLKLDLDKELRDSKMVIERMEYELHSAKEKIGNTMEERHRFEDHMAAMDNAQHVAQAQIQQYQREVQELSLVKVELSSQLADVANERQEFKVGLSDSRKCELAAREEIEVLRRRLKKKKVPTATLR